MAGTFLLLLAASVAASESDKSPWPRSAPGKVSREASYGIAWQHWEQRWSGISRAHFLRADLAAVAVHTRMSFEKFAFVTDGWYASGRAVALSPVCGECPGNLDLGAGRAALYYLSNNDARGQAGWGGEISYEGRVFFAPHPERPLLLWSDLMDFGPSLFLLARAPYAWEPRFTLSVPVAITGGMHSIARGSRLPGGWPSTWYAVRFELSAVRRTARWAGLWVRVGFEARRTGIRMYRNDGSREEGDERMWAAQARLGYDFLLSSVPRRPAASYRPGDPHLARRRFSVTPGLWISRAAFDLGGGSEQVDAEGAGVEVALGADRDWTAQRWGIYWGEGRARWSGIGRPAVSPTAWGAGLFHRWMAILRNHRPWFLGAGLSLAAESTRWRAAGAAGAALSARDFLGAGGVAAEARYTGDGAWEARLLVAVHPVGAGYRLAYLSGPFAGGARLGPPGHFLSGCAEIELTYRHSAHASLGFTLRTAGHTYAAENAPGGTRLWMVVPSVVVRLHSLLERPVFPDAVRAD